MLGPGQLASPGSDDRAVPDTYRRETKECFAGSELNAPCRVAVAVIGAGITGCSTALVLAERGIDVLVLEGRHVGVGASGRSFGQVVPYSKHDEHWTRRQFGVERGDAMIDFIATGPDVVWALIERHQIDCEATRGGILLAAHHPDTHRKLAAATEFWAARGAPVQLLKGSEVVTLTGSERYDLAMVDGRGATVNVFGYVQGLARAAQQAGARIVERCPVTGLSRAGEGWRLTTAAGEVRAERVVIATNAYSGSLWPGLGRSMIPMRGYGLVTEPIPPSIRRTILPQGHALTDTRRLFSGIRMRPDGRMNVSADGPPFRVGKAHRAKARRRVVATYPALDGIDFEEEWAGWIAITPAQFPGLHRLADGVWTALGYSGRGIALATLLGREVAQEVIGERNRPSPFPKTTLPVIPSRLGAIAYGQALLSWYRFRDRRDLRGLE